MLSKMKHWIISHLITPTRVRKLVAHAVSWLMQFCILRGAWDAISEFPRWLRKLADFIDGWNATELPEDKDRLISDLVKYAITDEAVDKLVDKISAMEVENDRREIPVVEQ